MIRLGHKISTGYVWDDIKGIRGVMHGLLEQFLADTSKATMAASAALA